MSESGGSGDLLILVILMNLVIWVYLLDKLHSEYGGSGGPGLSDDIAYLGCTCEFGGSV